MKHTTDENLTSLSLIHRAKTHDEDAWATLTEVYGPLIYYWCRSSGLSAEDSADTFQEVFRSVAKNLTAFTRHNGGSFRAWLWTITRNKIHDWRRGQSGKAQASGGTTAYQSIAELPDEEPPSLSRTQQTGIAKIVQRVMDDVRPAFNRTTWSAFWRVTIDEIPAAIVADELELSVDSVYQAKSRVTKKLRLKLGDVAELIF